MIYPANELPSRAPKPGRIATLYVFSSERDAAAGRPSFNPGCLRWQVSLPFLFYFWRSEESEEGY